ncbi:MAG: hypothetical protein U1E51_30575 [Candidatus Binatia bacterium]|nr:hypothetical protein [Candidatus Binatia bacterium]
MTKPASKFKPAELLEAIRQGQSVNEIRASFELHSQFIVEFAAGHGLTIPKQGPGPKNGRKIAPDIKYCPACKLPKPSTAFYDTDCYCKSCRRAQSARAYEKRMGRPVLAADKRHGNRGNRTPPPSHSAQSDFNDIGQARLPLIRAAKAGDRQAAEELYRRFKVVCK